MKNFIEVTSVTSGDRIFINVDHIGHFYKSEKDNITKIGVTTHNNGGFSVKETAEEISGKISSALLGKFVPGL
jgi:hypothetical protein